MSRASTSVHQVASRTARGCDASESRTLANSRPQSQNSVQMPSYAARVASANWNSRMARSTASAVPAARDRIQRSAGPRSSAAGATRRAVAGIDSGRAPRTNRVAFQSLFAKFRAFSTLARPNFWSWPGAEPWMSANRSASAPVVEMSSSGSTTLPLVLDIFCP